MTIVSPACPWQHKLVLGAGGASLDTSPALSGLVSGIKYPRQQVTVLSLDHAHAVFHVGGTVHGHVAWPFRSDARTGSGTRWTKRRWFLIVELLPPAACGVASVAFGSAHVVALVGFFSPACHRACHPA